MGMNRAEELRDQGKRHAAEAVRLACQGDGRAARVEVLKAYRLHEQSLRVALCDLRKRREVLERMVIHEAKSQN